MPRVSFSAYARHRGVTPAAVGLAVRKGRLRDSVFPHGKRRVIDVELADQEWKARTDTARGAAASLPADVLASQQAKTAQHAIAIDIRDAKLRRELAAAERAELELGVKRGELVRSADVSAAVSDAFARVRTRLLAVPSKARQRIPALTGADMATIEELIRDALNELADEVVE